MKCLHDIKAYSTILVDAMNLASRSHHGIRLSWQGRPTGMLYGVIRFVVNMREQFPKAEVVFLWEGGSNRRKRAYPLYKASREGKVSDGSFEESLMSVRQAVGWMGCTQVHHVGLEADDLAYWYTQQTFEDEAVLLVSTDEDWFQCLGPRVDIFRRELIETYADIQRTLGYPPERIGLFKVLCGDKSDGVPGIPGMRVRVAKSIVSACSGYMAMIDEDLSAVVPGWDAVLEEIKASWDVVERNAELVLFHPEWVDETLLVRTRGVRDSGRLRDLVEENGMVAMLEKLENYGYVDKQG